MVRSTRPLWESSTLTLSPVKLATRTCPAGLSIAATTGVRPTGTVRRTVWRVVSITLTVPSSQLATKACPVRASTVTSLGPCPTGMTRRTVPVRASRIATLLPAKLATYTCPRGASTATATGTCPTGTVRMRRPRSPSSRLTVPAPKLATNTCPLLSSTARASGPPPTRIVRSSAPVRALMTLTLPRLKLATKARALVTSTATACGLAPYGSSPTPPGMRRTSRPVAVARTLVVSRAATIANPVWPSVATAMGCRPTGVVWRRRPDAAQAGGPGLAATALHARTRRAQLLRHLYRRRPPPPDALCLILVPSSLRDARSLTRHQARLLPGSAEDAAHGVGVGIAVGAVRDQGAALANLIPGIDEHDALTHRPLGMGIDPLTRRSCIAGKRGRGAARVGQGRLLLTGGEALVPAQRDHRDVGLGQVGGDAVPHRLVVLHQTGVGDGHAGLLVAHMMIAGPGRHGGAFPHQPSVVPGIAVRRNRGADGNGDAWQANAARLPAQVVEGAVHVGRAAEDAAHVLGAENDEERLCPDAHVGRLREVGEPR